jgi:alkanesulfonate monooxygenase SsuD/methylene tetrahydromethanopterin reductase-like flavin-dependent oxidoreductase (luciferase family)
MMKFGICLASRPEDVDYVVDAERLGFTHVWAADSQMIWSDVYAIMALIASRTTSMHIGTGVAVPSTRTAPVTAAAHATINQIAPGRVFCALGTGNTAMRIMGHPPMRINEFDQYLGDLRGFLDGAEVDYQFRGRTSLVRHVMPDTGFVRFAPRIPMYVSAFGPKALAVAVRHGDGLITSLPSTPDAVQSLWGRIRRTAREQMIGINRTKFPIANLTTMVVLRDGETLESDRVKQQTGAFAIASLHYAYEQMVQFGRRPPADLGDIWDDYVRQVELTGPERRHQRIHLGHNCWVIPEEEPFVTPELIDRTCMVGTPDQLRSRVQQLYAAGLDQLVILPPLAEKEAVIADIAGVFALSQQPA